MRKIIPSLIAKSQRELNQRFAKVGKHFGVFQLDIMDGRFVKNKSFMFNFKLPKNKKYEAHLMIENPLKWIEKNWKKADVIIFHIESCKSHEEVAEILEFLKSKKKKIGIAINPETNAREILQYKDAVNKILVLTVHPGKYGSRFIPQTLKKIKEIRKMKRKIAIEVDGGINEETIRYATNAGADFFVVGSYLQKSKNPEGTANEMARIISKRLK
ncbi:MAG: ribulose-phosphate 3-epimerase [Nanoarchaeota archaeon]